MSNQLFNTDTLDLNKFRTIVYTTSSIIEDTGLEVCGMRADGGVIGFGVRGDDRDFVSYNIDMDRLYVNYDVVTGTQARRLHMIAELLGLTTQEFKDDRFDTNI